MKVRFTTNLGSQDAAKLGVDHRECTAGSVLDVGEGFTSVLEKMGLGSAVELVPAPEPAAKPVDLKAVPAVEAKSEVAADQADSVEKKKK